MAKQEKPAAATRAAAAKPAASKLASVSPDAQLKAAQLKAADELKKTASHATRMVKALEAGYVIEGARAVDPSNSEVGFPIALSPEERAALVPAFINVLKARKE